MRRSVLRLGLVSPVGIDSILSSRRRISARTGPRLVSDQLVCPLSCDGLFPMTPLLLVVVGLVVGLAGETVAYSIAVGFVPSTVEYLLSFPPAPRTLEG